MASESQTSQAPAVLMQLAKDKALHGGDLAAAFRVVTEQVAVVLGVERVGVWLFTDDRSAIECADLFESSAARHTQGGTLTADEYPRYFAALESCAVVAADDARYDERTSEFVDSYLVPNNIWAMMDAPILVGGELLGIICCECCSRERDWTEVDELFVRSAADLTGIAFEAHQRRKVETTLRAREEQYRLLAEHAPDPIFALDNAGVYTYISPAITVLLGYSAEELIGRSVLDPELDIIDDEAEDVARQVMEAVAGQRDEAHFTIAMKGKSGERIMTEVRAVAVRDDAGALTAMQGVFRDITARWDAERATARSEMLLNRAQEMASVGAWTWWPASNMVECSPIICAILGLPPGRQEMPLDELLQFVHPEDRRIVLASARAAFRGAPPGGTEFRVQPTDGSERVVFTRAEVVRDETGQVAEVLGMLQDITQRREIEGTLREREHDLAIAQEVGQLGSWKWNTSSDLVICSSETCRILGIDETAEGLPLMAFAELVPGEAIGALTQEIANARAGTTSGGIEVEFTRGDGEVRIALLRAELFVEEAGSGKFVHGTIQDITERKHLESQLQQAQKMEAVGTLAGGIAHDFNNLLTGILGGVELALMDAPANSRFANSLRQVQEAGERAADLTRDLLTLSRKHPRKIEAMDVNAVVRETAKLLERSIPATVRTTMDLDPELPTFKGDARQLNQALLNLGINARDAMPEGGTLHFLTRYAVPKEIAVAPESIGGDVEYVCIEVEDSGEGMAASELDHIFEPFYTTKDQGKGTGLGLAMVYGCVQAHNGWIHVESELGRGTVFRLYVPLIEPGIAIPARSTSELPVGTETVLLVDDTDSILYLGRGMLERCGYTVLTAWNGEEALAHCEEHGNDIAVIVTDLVMPKVGGREMLRRLRERGWQTPVILTSGHGMAAAPDEVGRNGFVRFVEKPFDLFALARVIREVLDGD